MGSLYRTSFADTESIVGGYAARVTEYGVAFAGAQSEGTDPGVAASNPGMNAQAKVVSLWPRPESVAERWAIARLRIRLQLAHGRASDRRRARILARVARAVDSAQGLAEGSGHLSGTHRSHEAVNVCPVPGSGAGRGGQPLLVERGRDTSV